MRRGGLGFSLLELMTVLAILGILVSVAFPSFKYLSSTTKIKSASTELYLALIRARNEAVKRNRKVSVSMDAAGWQAGWQIIADANNDNAFTAGAPDLIVNTGGELKRVTVTETGGLTSVVFLASGRVREAPEFQISSSETASMKRCITADLTGKPATKEGACP